MRIRVMRGDEELLAFKPDEPHANQQDARHNAALQFVKWVAHSQMTGEDLLRDEHAVHSNDEHGDESDECVPPVFSYFDFVKMMATQFKLDHEAEVWSQPSPVTAPNAVVLDDHVIEDMLGDQSLMKMTLESGRELVDDEVKSYRGKLHRMHHTKLTLQCR